MKDINDTNQMTRESAYRKLAVSREYYHSEWGPLILGAQITGDIIHEIEPNILRYSGFRPYNHAGAMVEVLQREQKNEMNIASETVRDHMARLGILAHKNEIIYGLNKSMGRVQLWDDSQRTHLLILRAIMHHDSTSLVDFGIEYVERWKMYNELFGGQE